MTADWDVLQTVVDAIRDAQLLNQDDRIPYFSSRIWGPFRFIAHESLHSITR